MLHSLLFKIVVCSWAFLLYHMLDPHIHSFRHLENKESQEHLYHFTLRKVKTRNGTHQHSLRLL